MSAADERRPALSRPRRTKFTDETEALRMEEVVIGEYSTICDLYGLPPPPPPGGRAAFRAWDLRYIAAWLSGDTLRKNDR